MTNTIGGHAGKYITARPNRQNVIQESMFQESVKQESVTPERVTDDSVLQDSFNT